MNVRRATREFLAHRGAAHAADDMEATLVVSELVANALRHGHGRCRLRLSLDECGQLVIEVHDQNPDHPKAQAPSTSAESGRGIALVEALCRRFSVVDDAEGGKTVRAVLAAA